MTQWQGEFRISMPDDPQEWTGHGVIATSQTRGRDDWTATMKNATELIVALVRNPPIATRGIVSNKRFAGTGATTFVIECSTGERLALD